MQLLIAHSKSTEAHAWKLAKVFPGEKWDRIQIGNCDEEHLPQLKGWREKYKKYHIVAVGGGMVIDAAKIIGGLDKRIVAYPQTAAGAHMTTRATIWGKRKYSERTALPIYPGCIMPALLPEYVKTRTAYDALAHACESYWSSNATYKSREISVIAIKLLRENEDFDFRDLVNAGTLAGKAIETTGTNMIHAISYAITTMYDIEHSTAVAMAFWPVIYAATRYYSSQNHHIPANLPRWKPIYLPKNFDIPMIWQEAETYVQHNAVTWSIDNQDIKDALRKYQR